MNELKNKEKNYLKLLKPNRIVLPLSITLGLVMYLLFSRENIEIADIWEKIVDANPKWIIIAFFMLLIRDITYMYRIRYISDGNLSWRSSFYVIVLWEFASAVTPSVVGGTAAAVFILNKEKIKLSKSIAYVMLTAVFDNAFFIVASLFVYFFMAFSLSPIYDVSIPLLGNIVGLKTLFFVSICLIILYTFIMFFGLFIRPYLLRRILLIVTSNRLFKRWKHRASKLGQDIAIASSELKRKSLTYWIRAIVSTLIIWIARYFMLNCIIASFTDIDIHDHVVIFCREIVMWVIMLASPTPGSSGTAEYIFEFFFKDFFAVAGLALIVGVLWRLFTYYSYLLIGVFVFPRWLKRIVKK